MLPGILLSREAAAEVFSLIEGKLGRSTARDWQSISLDATLELIGRLPQEEFYAYYRHPVHEFKDQCSLCKKRELVDFLVRTFRKERGDGMDVYFSPLDASIVLAGNHDGDLYRAA